MSDFERYCKEDPPFERTYQIEKNVPIELEYGRRKDKIIFRDPSDNPKIQDESTVLGKKYKIAKELLSEKEPSKITESKPKRIYRKANKTAVASIQKKL